MHRTPIRFGEILLLLCATPTASAQEQHIVGVEYEFKKCQKFAEEIQATPGIQDDFEVGLCGDFTQPFPVWKFEPRDDGPRLKLYFRGNDTAAGPKSIDDLEIDVRVEVVGTETRTVLDWGRLFAKEEVATFFHSIRGETRTRLKQILTDELDEARTAVSSVPVSRGFVECQGTNLATLPLTWSEFKAWSFSHFKSEFSNPSRATIWSEALGKHHKHHVSVQHTRVKHVGQEERPVGNEDLTPFTTGDTYIVNFVKNDSPDSDEPVATRQSESTNNVP